MAANTIDISGDGGVLKEILVEGTGTNHPIKDDEVFVHYVGTLASDGSKFDSSRDRNSPFKFTIGTGNVIKGWDIGVATMKQGEKSIFTIRSDYAYGDKGSGPKIPPKATLKFEIELLRFGEIEVENTYGGVRVRLIEKGDGWLHPRAGDEVFIKYVATSGGEEFARVDEVTKVPLGQRLLPDGVETALQHELRKGSKAIITCKPSHSSGFGVPGAEVVYNLELTDWNAVFDVFHDGGVIVRCNGHSDHHKRVDDGCKGTFEVSAKHLDGTVIFETRTLDIRVGDEQSGLPPAFENAVQVLKFEQTATVTIDGRYNSLGFEGVAPNTPVQIFVKVVECQQSHITPVEEKLIACNFRREAGNALFKKGDLAKALEKYNSAFNIVQFTYESDEEKKKQLEQAKLLCHLNRSAVYKKRNEAEPCLTECDSALKLDPTNAKALFRRGWAHYMLSDLDSAIIDLKQAKQSDPSVAGEVDGQLQLVAKKQKAIDDRDKRMYAKMFGGVREEAGAKKSESAGTRSRVG
eukprot:c7318_g1_i3.p1 GENE.c7318_g1_i3~~c7318_g1_i3.p1  ORF type:complete len:521 (+),score=135.48 c7318_g1_i3:47-1609(+)